LSRTRIHPTDLLAIALCAALAGFLWLVMGGWRYDDPYITYRYAENIRAGIGFVYNPGQRILSTTTPLFALVLAGLQNPRLDAPTLAALLGCISLALGGLAFWAMGRAWKAQIAGWAGLVLYPLFPLAFVTLGSETPLYLALCLWAFALAAHKRYALAGVCAGLAFVARGDGALAGLVIGVWLVAASLAGNQSKITPLIRFGLGWLIPVAPWLIFATLYFGSPLPVTMAVKQAQGRMAISTPFAQGFATVQGWYLGGWQYRLEAALAGIGALSAILFLRKNKMAGFWLLALWSAIYFASYAALGVSSYFWYYAPLAPGFVAALGMCLQQVVAWSTHIRFGESHRSFTLVSRLAAMACLVLIGLLGFMQAQSAIGTARLAADKRVGIYRAVGEWLNANTPPGESVGALEVGIIGYYSHRPMIDFAGLIQPEVAQVFGRETTYDDAAIAAFRKFHPAYIAQIENALPALQAETARQNCAVAARFSGANYGYAQNMIILKCN